MMAHIYNPSIWEEARWSPSSRIVLATQRFQDRLSYSETLSQNTNQNIKYKTKQKNKKEEKEKSTIKLEHSMC